MTLCHVLVMTKAIFSSLDDFSLDNLGSDAELIPLMTSEDEEALEKEKSNLTIKGDLVRQLFITSTMGVSYKIKMDKSI